MEKFGKDPTNKLTWQRGSKLSTSFPNIAPNYNKQIARPWCIDTGQTAEKPQRSDAA
jgi:hypothetical protein